MPLSRIGTNSITDYAIGATDLANNSIETYTSNAGRPLTNRNLIINGAMQVAQRNTSVTGITTSDCYTADRWQLHLSSAGTWTMNVESSGPTDTEFRRSANVICTTADSSLSAGDFFAFRQLFEGQNLQVLKKGTANAESISVSFWTKSSNTGTFICELLDSDNNRHFSKSYTINTANTWEKKTLSFSPDTTGTIAYNITDAFRLIFWLAAGSTLSSGTLPTSWSSVTNANRVAGQLNLANLSGNYWAVTGIQLETGTVATPYEWIDYGTELRKCQRYYEKIVNTGGLLVSKVAGATTYFIGNYKVSKRATPTVSLPAVSTASDSSSHTPFANGTEFGGWNATLGGSLTNNVNSFTLIADAEL